MRAPISKPPSTYARKREKVYATALASFYFARFDITTATPLPVYSVSATRGTLIAAATIRARRKGRRSLRVVSAMQKCEAGRRQRRKEFRGGRGLIYSRCNFQYFSDQVRADALISVGALLPRGTVEQRPPTPRRAATFPSR